MEFRTQTNEEKSDSDEFLGEQFELAKQKRQKITVSKALKIPRQDQMKTSLAVPSGARLTWDEMNPSDS